MPNPDFPLAVFRVPNPDLGKILVRNPDLGKSLGAHGGEMPDPDLERVCNPDFPAMPKSGLGTGHKSLTRSSHLQVRVKDPGTSP